MFGSLDAHVKLPVMSNHIMFMIYAAFIGNPALVLQDKPSKLDRLGKKVCANGNTALSETCKRPKKVLRCVGDGLKTFCRSESSWRTEYMRNS